MQKWEYKTLKFETKGIMGGKIELEGLEAQLNQSGQIGWELVSSFVTAQSYGASKEVVAILKRPTQEG